MVDPVFLAVAAAIPAAAILGRDVQRSGPDAKYFFAFNLLALVVLLVTLFGYPALILLAITAAATMFVLILWLTSQDLIEQATRRRQTLRSPQTDRKHS